MGYLYARRGGLSVWLRMGVGLIERKGGYLNGT